MLGSSSTHRMRAGFARDGSELAATSII
jgi:hypothetical protein